VTTIDVDTETEDAAPVKGEADRRALLRIYFNDHRAGAAAATARLRRMIDVNEGTPLGDTLVWVLHEIEEDIEVLESAMHHLDVTSNPLKNLVAKAGERLGRLKANGRLRRYSPLSRVLELEGLMAAIDMKRRIWESLQIAVGGDRLGDIDLGRYLRRADVQRERLRSHHEEAVAAAFGQLDL
jgi:hypothetical protein